MKKIIALIISMALFLPVMADTGAAKVKAGPIGVSVDNTKENQFVSVSRAGDLITFGCAYSKTKLAGADSSSTGVLFTLQFDSITGDLEEGATYDLSHSDPSSLNTIAVLARIKNLKGIAITTIAEELADNVSTSTGKLKVTKYDPATGLISGDLSVEVAPVLVTRGGKAKVSSKGVNIKMSFTDWTLD